MKMIRCLFANALVFYCLAASAADSMSIAEIRNTGLRQLSAAELQEIMPGAKVVHVTGSGSRRTWTNATNGTFLASSDGAGSRIGPSVVGMADGEWNISPKGEFCTKFNWKGSDEKWCRLVFEAGNGRYYAAEASNFNREPRPKDETTLVGPMYITPVKAAVGTTPSRGSGGSGVGGTNAPTAPPPQ